MIWIIFFILILLIYLQPYIDFFKDYRGQKHFIIWYSFNGKRKFIDLIGNQQ